MKVQQKREEGNNFFKEAKYFAAYGKYLEAIKECPQTDKLLLSQLYTNLSATARFLEKLNEAIDSATKALEYDPSNFKAYLRRGDALAESLDWSGAYNDYLEASKMQPDVQYFKDKMEYARRNSEKKRDFNDTMVPPPVTPPPVQDTSQSTQNAEKAAQVRQDRYGRPSPFARDESTQNKSQLNAQPVSSQANQQQLGNVSQLQAKGKTDENANSNLTDTTASSEYISIDGVQFSPEYVKSLMNDMLNDRRPSEDMATKMLNKMKEMMKEMPNIVHVTVNKEIRVVGDTHGQFQDVLALFETYGYPSRTNPYLFNGDYVDRGSMSIEIVLSLIAWKFTDPECIHLNRGNHETHSMNVMYGFEKECMSKYTNNFYYLVSDFFNYLPVGYILNKKVFVVHGGLCDKNLKIADINRLNRFTQPTENSPINDLLWADPMEMPGYAMSPRGVTRTFGPDITQNFLRNNGLDLLIRSHQVQERGYSIMHNGLCITVFSAPNYIGEMNNLGATLLLRFDETGALIEKKFETFQAKPIPSNYPPMKYANLW